MLSMGETTYVGMPRLSNEPRCTVKHGKYEDYKINNSQFPLNFQKAQHYIMM